MFSDNEKISLRQLKRIVVFDLFSISWLIIPRIAVETAGRDGLSAIILSIIIALIYAGFLLLLTKSIENNLMDYATRTVGKFLTFIIGVLYIIKLVACTVLVTRLFGEVIKETLLEDTDTRLIVFLLLLVSSYAASKGVEVRARITEVLYFIVIIPIFFFTLMGIREVDLSNLLPIFTEKPADIIYGGYLIFLTFTMLELLLFSIPLVNTERDCLKKEKRIFRYLVQSILIVGILDLLFFIVTAGILGMQETKAKLWSTITIIQSIDMPGGFIKRQDAFLLGIWMLSIFTLISGFIYYLSFFTKHIFHSSSHKYYIFVVTLLLFGICALPMDLEIYFDYFEFYMKYIGMPQSIIIPSFVVLISKLRKVKRKSALKTMMVFFLIFSVSSLTGCKDMTEIEDRNFVQTMGIDLEGDEITVYYVLPDLEAITGQGSTDSDKLTIELKGKDFWEIEEKNQLQSDKRLDFSHIKAIILGKELAEDAMHLDEFLRYIENKYELGRNTLVFLSEDKAIDIIKLNGDVTNGVGEYLERLHRINLMNVGKEEVLIGDLIQSKNEDNLVTMVPIIAPREKSLENTGLGIFSNNKLAAEITEEVADYIYLAYGYGKNNRLFIGNEPDVTIDASANENEESKDLDDTNNLVADKEDDTDYVIKINNITRQIDFTWSNNKPFMKLKLSGYGSVDKGFLEAKQTTEVSNQDIIKLIENQTNKQITEVIKEQFALILKEKEIDFLNLYRMTSYKNRSIWLVYQDNTEQFIKDLEYVIEVDMKFK
jgi:spore germination protein (amino acid permease)